MVYTTEVPIDQVLSMIEQGIDSSEIIRKLQDQGFSNTDIQEALNQAKIKASMEHEENKEDRLVPPPPAMMRPSMREDQQIMMEQPMPVQQPPMQEISPRDVEEKIEEIAESIIGEKWRRLATEAGDFASWKEKVRVEIVSIKQEVLRVEQRFESLQNAILGRMKEYDRSVDDVSTDVKAVEKLLQEILKPLADNVKELKHITDKMKK